MARILVVDDEPDALEFLAEEFGDRGFEVSTALNGKDAIESVKANPPDLLFLEETGSTVCVVPVAPGMSTPSLRHW